MVEINACHGCMSVFKKIGVHSCAFARRDFVVAVVGMRHISTNTHTHTRHSRTHTSANSLEKHSVLNVRVYHTTHQRSHKEIMRFSIIRGEAASYVGAYTRVCRSRAVVYPMYTTRSVYAHTLPPK